jgi:hypothetical protein
MPITGLRLETSSGAVVTWSGTVGGAPLSCKDGLTFDRCEFQNTAGGATVTAQE